MFRENKPDKSPLDALNNNNHQSRSISSRFDLKTLDQMNVQPPSTQIRLIPRHLSRNVINIPATTPQITSIQSQQYTPTFTKSPRIRNIIPAKRTPAPDIFRNTSRIQLDNKPPIIKKRHLIRKTCTMPISKHPFEEPISVPSSPRRIKKIVSRNTSPEAIEVDQEKLKYLESLLNERGLNKYSLKMGSKSTSDSSRFLLPAERPIQSENTDTVKFVIPKTTSDQIQSEKMEKILDNTKSEKIDAVKFVLLEKPVKNNRLETKDFAISVLSEAQPQKPAELIANLLLETTKTTPSNPSNPIDHALSAQKSQELMKYIERKKRESKRLQKLEEQKTLELKRKIHSEQEKLKEYQLKQREQIKLLREKKELERKVLEKENAEKALFDKEQKEKIEKEKQELLDKLIEKEKNNAIMESVKDIKLKVDTVDEEKTKIIFMSNETAEKEKKLSEVKLMQDGMIEKNKSLAEKPVQLDKREEVVGVSLLPSSLLPIPEIKIESVNIQSFKSQEANPVSSELSNDRKLTDAKMNELTDAKMNVEEKIKLIINQDTVGERKLAQTTSFVVDIDSALQPISSNTILLNDLKNIEDQKPISHNNYVLGESKTVDSNVLKTNSLEQECKSTVDSDLKDAKSEYVSFDTNASPSVTNNERLQPVIDDQVLFVSDFEVARAKHNGERLATLTQLVYSLGERFENLAKSKDKKISNQYQDKQSQAQKPPIIEGKVYEEEVGVCNLNEFNNRLKNELKRKHAAITIQAFYKRKIKPKTAKLLKKKQLSNNMIIEGALSYGEGISSDVSQLKGVGNFSAIHIDRKAQKDLEKENGRLNSSFDGLARSKDGDKNLIANLTKMKVCNLAQIPNDKKRMVDAVEQDMQVFMENASNPIHLAQSQINADVSLDQLSKSAIAKLPDPALTKFKNLNAPIVSKDEDSMVKLFAKRLYHNTKTNLNWINENYELSRYDTGRGAVTEVEIDLKDRDCIDKVENSVEHLKNNHGSGLDPLSANAVQSVKFDEKIQNDWPIEPQSEFNSSYNPISPLIQKNHEMEVSQAKESVLVKKTKADELKPAHIEKEILKSNTVSVQTIDNRSLMLDKTGKVVNSSKNIYNMECKSDDYSLDFENEDRISYVLETDNYSADIEKDKDIESDGSKIDIVSEDFQPSSPPARRIRKNKPKNLLMSKRQIDPQSLSRKFALEFQAYISVQEASIQITEMEKNREIALGKQMQADLVKVLNERELMHKMEIESARKERLQNAKISDPLVSSRKVKPSELSVKDRLYDSVSDFQITKDYESVSDFSKGTEIFEKDEIDSILDEHIKSSNHVLAPSDKRAHEGIKPYSSEPNKTEPKFDYTDDFDQSDLERLLGIRFKFDSGNLPEKELETHLTTDVTSLHIKSNKKKREIIAEREKQQKDNDSDSSSEISKKIRTAITKYDFKKLDKKEQKLKEKIKLAEEVIGQKSLFEKRAREYEKETKRVARLLNDVLLDVKLDDSNSLESDSNSNSVKIPVKKKSEMNSVQTSKKLSAIDIRKMIPDSISEISSQSIEEIISAKTSDQGSYISEDFEDFEDEIAAVRNSIELKPNFDELGSLKASISKASVDAKMVANYEVELSPFKDDDIKSKNSDQYNRANNTKIDSRHDDDISSFEDRSFKHPEVEFQNELEDHPSKDSKFKNDIKDEKISIKKSNPISKTLDLLRSKLTTLEIKEQIDHDLILKRDQAIELEIQIAEEHIKKFNLMMKKDLQDRLKRVDVMKKDIKIFDEHLEEKEIEIMKPVNQLATKKIQDLFKVESGGGDYEDDFSSLDDVSSFNSAAKITHRVRVKENDIKSQNEKLSENYLNGEKFGDFGTVALDKKHNTEYDCNLIKSDPQDSKERDSKNDITCEIEEKRLSEQNRLSISQTINVPLTEEIKKAIDGSVQKQTTKDEENIQVGNDALSVTHPIVEERLVVAKMGEKISLIDEVSIQILLPQSEDKNLVGKDIAPLTQKMKGGEKTTITEILEEINESIQVTLPPKSELQIKKKEITNENMGLNDINPAEQPAESRLEIEYPTRVNKEENSFNPAEKFTSVTDIGDLPEKSAKVENSFDRIPVTEGCSTALQTNQAGSKYNEIDTGKCEDILVPKQTPKAVSVPPLYSEETIDRITAELFGSILSEVLNDVNIMSALTAKLKTNLSDTSKCQETKVEGSGTENVLATAADVPLNLGKLPPLPASKQNTAPSLPLSPSPKKLLLRSFTEQIEKGLEYVLERFQNSLVDTEYTIAPTISESVLSGLPFETLLGVKELIMETLNESIAEQFEKYKYYGKGNNDLLRKIVVKPRPITKEELVRESRNKIELWNGYNSKHGGDLDQLLVQTVKKVGKNYCDLDEDEAHVKDELVTLIWEELLGDTTEGLEPLFMALE